jgi:hypothetical protein
MKIEKATDLAGRKPIKAVLFKSEERFASFGERLSECGVDCTVLDFERDGWLQFDYNSVDIAIYYPTFKFSSNHPLALHEVHDNLMFIHSEYPHIKFYPDPKIIQYYNDKYKQFLFLKKHEYPIPETIPLFSQESVDLADRELGYPMVIKNRYGAGGGSVFRVVDRNELERFYNVSRLDFFNAGSARYFWSVLNKRIFYYHLIKEKKSPYPLLSPPLLAQRYITMDRDLKTVVGNYKVVEGHWRLQANKDMWKVNIDGGGTGVWGKIPQEAIDLSVKLAKHLQATWLNIDLVPQNGDFLITEFSPVWHHYAYKEKPSFVYEDDYNLDTPLEDSLDLEKIIVESLIEAARRERKGT